MSQLDEEVKRAFEARQRNKEAKERQEAVNLQSRLERHRQDVLNGSIWPKCGSEACVRARLAKDMTVPCVKCGEWWNF
jgi:hypothetical protein